MTGLKTNEIVEPIVTNKEEIVEPIVEPIIEPTTDDATAELKKQVEQLQESLNKKDETLKQLELNAKKAEEESFAITLRDNGLEGFEGIFKTESKAEQVEILKQAVNDILIAKSYVPKDKINQSEYDSHIQNNDVQGAIKSKFSKLFGI